MTRDGMAALVAERLNVDLVTASIRVADTIPIEEYDRYGELDTEQQEAWIDVIREDLNAQRLARMKHNHNRRINGF